MDSERTQGSQRGQQEQEMLVQYAELKQQGTSLLTKRAEIDLELRKLSERIAPIYTELAKSGAALGISPEPF